MTSNWSVSQFSPPKPNMRFSPYVPHAPLLSWFLIDLPNNTWGAKSWSSLICSLLQSPVTSSLLRQNIFLSTPFVKILSLSSSRNVKDLFSHPYTTTGTLKQMGRQRTLDRMVEGIYGVQSVRNFFMNAILTC
jgi:hypothetical protein